MSALPYDAWQATACQFDTLLRNGARPQEAAGAVKRQYRAERSRLGLDGSYDLIVLAVGGLMETAVIPEAPEDDDGWLPAEIINIDDAKPQAPPPAPPPKPPRKRKVTLRHEDWERIREYANQFVATNGPWPNPNAAAVAISVALKDLSISHNALSDGIKNHFPEWLVPDYKE